MRLPDPPWGASGECRAPASGMQDLDNGYRAVRRYTKSRERPVRARSPFPPSVDALPPASRPAVGRLRFQARALSTRVPAWRVHAPAILPPPALAPRPRNSALKGRGRSTCRLLDAPAFAVISVRGGRAVERARRHPVLAIIGECVNISLPRFTSGRLIDARSHRRLYESEYSIKRTTRCSLLCLAVRGESQKTVSIENV
jgi:hypothetical protein